MLVSTSIFSSKNRDINDLIREIQEASTDMIHFDFPMNTTPDFSLLSKLRTKSRLPFDGHLIHPDSISFLDKLEELGFDQTAIQEELLAEEELLDQAYNDSGDIANPNPKCLYIDMNQQEVLDMVSSTPYHFSIIPVLDRDNKIISTTSSDRVIRGK